MVLSFAVESKGCYEIFSDRLLQQQQHARCVYCFRLPRRQLILNRAAPTLVRSLESGQSRGVLHETSTIAVASMAKQFVGDLVEEGVCIQSMGLAHIT